MLKGAGAAGLPRGGEQLLPVRCNLHDYRWAQCVCMFEFVWCLFFLQLLPVR